MIAGGSALAQAPAGAVLAPVTGQGTKDDPYLLGRNGKWVLRRQDDACMLAGSFGTGDRKIIVRFYRFAPDSAFTLHLSGEALASSDVRDRIVYGLGDEEPAPLWVNVGRGQTADGQRTPPVMVVQGAGLRVAPIMAEQKLARAETLLFSTPGHGWFRLKLEPMREPVAVLDQCTQAVVRQWGFDPQAMAALSRQPTPTVPPQQWLTARDMPAFRRWGEAMEALMLRLDIGGDGAITGCHPLLATQPDQFSPLACDAIRQRARFQPALDAGGKPVASYYLANFSINLDHHW